MARLNLRGVDIHKNHLDRDAQRVVLDAVREIVRVAPFYQPVTARGQKMSVRMTAAGTYGWVADGKGYHYDAQHPDGTGWPAIPACILNIWNAISGCDRQPECCLINYYGEGARMGLHQDRDEVDYRCPVVSISLGDDGLFRVGNDTRGGPTESIWLQSGDVVVLGGAARLVHHGVDRIRFGTSRLLPKGGRINLTLRVVT